MNTENEKPTELIKPVPPLVVFTIGFALLKSGITLFEVLGVAVLTAGTIYLFMRLIMWFLKARKEI